MTAATQDIFDVLPLHPFHIMIKNFSANAVHLPNTVAVANDKEPPTAVLTVSKWKLSRV